LLIYLKQKGKLKSSGAHDKAETINFKLVKEVLLKIFDVFEIYEKDNAPDLHLFIWALLTHRIEIAKIFWRLGTVWKEFLFYHLS
jgi:hypothetical protein